MSKDKNKCPIEQRKCHYTGKRTLYEDHGKSVITIPICISKYPQQFAVIVDLGDYGIEKHCRKDLYRAHGIVKVIEREMEI